MYGIIVLIVYGWTIISFFWKLPSWQMFITLGEILVILAYTLVVNLLESLAVLCLPVFLSIVLPKKWYYDSFITRSSILTILGLGYMMYFAQRVSSVNPYPVSLVRTTPWVFCVLLLATFTLDRIAPLRRFVEGFADRSVIFLYLSIPFSLLSLLIFVIHSVV